MFQKRRGWLLGLLAGVLAAAMVFPAYGSKRSPIKSITFSIKANILPIQNTERKKSSLRRTAIVSPLMAMRC